MTWSHFIQVTTTWKSSGINEVWRGWDVLLKKEPKECRDRRKEETAASSEMAGLRATKMRLCSEGTAGDHRVPS